jgi:preprotein translocase SecF subunit
MSNLLKLDELLKYGRMTVWLSAIVILIGLSAVVYRGGFLYGIDFTGGLKLEFQFTEPIDAELLTQIRTSLQQDGSSVQVKTFSLPQHDRNRGLMITVRAQQMVSSLTNQLYERGDEGSEGLFEEIARSESVRWVDAATLRRHFRVGDGDDDRVDITSDSRDVIEQRVQNIVNETLSQEVISNLRQALGGRGEGIDLNWASRAEIEQWLETEQLDALASDLRSALNNQSPQSVSDLAPVLRRYDIDVSSFGEIFSIGAGTRAQVNLRRLGDADLREILREEFIGDRYGNVAREVVSTRRNKGLFQSVEDVLSMDTMNGLNTDPLKDSASTSPFVMIRTEMVSPSIGSELIGKSALAILISLVGILIYLYIRFELTYSLGAIAAILHDVAITLGLLTLLGIEFDVSVVAAVLTMIGYSLNDTIVNFDRVRENRSLMGYQSTWYEVINRSIHEVLNRTMVTSITTFIAVFVLYWFGGIALRAFSITLIIGIVVGTYSSIFVSNLSLYHLQKSLRDT